MSAAITGRLFVLANSGLDSVWLSLFLHSGSNVHWLTSAPRSPLPYHTTHNAHRAQPYLWSSQIASNAS